MTTGTLLPTRSTAANSGNRLLPGRSPDHHRPGGRAAPPAHQLGRVQGRGPHSRRSATWPAGWASAARRCARRCGSSRPRDFSSSGRGRPGDHRRQPSLAELRRPPGSSLGSRSGTHHRTDGDPQRGGDRGGRAGRPQGHHRRPAPPVHPPHRPRRACSPPTTTWPSTRPSPKRHTTPCSSGSSRNRWTCFTITWPPSSAPTTRSPAGASPCSSSTTPSGGPSGRATSRRRARRCATTSTMSPGGSRSWSGTGRMMRLVFIDLDGTLALGSAAHLRAGQADHRQRARGRSGGGSGLVPASAGDASLPPAARAHDPVIACDGALLWNVQAGAGSSRASLPAAGSPPRSWRPGPRPGRRWPTWRATTSGSPTGWANLERDGILNYEVSDPHEVGTRRRGATGGRADRQGLPRPARPGRRGARPRPSSPSSDVFGNGPPSTRTPRASSTSRPSTPPRPRWRNSSPGRCRSRPNRPWPSATTTATPPCCSGPASAWPWATPLPPPRRRPTSSPRRTCGTASPRRWSSGCWAPGRKW